MNNITNALWVGDIQDARTGDTSRFDRVVTVCQNDVRENVSCAYSWFNLADGEPASIAGGECTYSLFSDAVDAVVGSLDLGEKVFVHCHAGQSRSVMVCVAALAVTEGLGYDRAYWRVRSSRGTVHPAPELRRFAQKYIREYPA